jgi:general secretion pathway protein D
MFRNKILKVVFTPVLCMSVLSACELAESYTKVDRSGDMVRGDYRKALDGKPAEADIFADEFDRSKAMPDMLPLDAADERTANITGNIPVVSVSVNQAVPVREILFDLATRADFNLILDPAISGSIIYSAKSKPFDQVITEISDLAGLKHMFNGRNLRIELDRPFMKRYNVSYLNLNRGFQSSVNASVSVGGGEAGSGNGSSYALNSSSESDFWASLGADIAQIMDLSEEFNAVLRTLDDPQLEIIQVAQASSNSEDENSDDENNNDENSSESGDADNSQEEDNSASAESSGDGAGASDEASGGSAAFIVNRLAGMVTVFGTTKQQKLVEEYLNDLQRSVGTQILIEAKILEVELNDEFAAGINWEIIFKESLGLDNFVGSFPAPLLTPNQAGSFTFTLNREDINSTVSALNRFGTVRALASPRLSVMNNQSAALNVARNEVFFELEIDQEVDDAGNVITTVESEINTVPEGVIINVMPIANPDTNEVMMSVRPSVTRVAGTVNDPAVAFANVPGLESQVPIVDIREIDTMVKMLSGEVVVIGGLMQDRAASEQEGVPVASDVPLLGSLFRNQGDNIQKYELVVLIRAIILDGRSNVHPTDHYLYKNFSQDRRPFKM